MKTKKLLFTLLLLSFTAAGLQCSDNHLPTPPEPPQTPDKPQPPVRPEDDKDFEAIRAAVIAETAVPGRTAKADNVLAKFNRATGSFKDIDYADRTRNNWQPRHHLERLTELVRAYTDKNCPYYGKDELYDCLVAGLTFWYERNPKSENWWQNRIAVPKDMGLLLVHARTGLKRIPADLEKKILDRLRQVGGDPEGYTGANCTDIALHWLYRACLSGNRKELRHATEVVFRTVSYTEGEGLQHDNSFFQHGAQLYIGGYGGEFLKGITLMALYVRDTPFRLEEEKIGLLSEFIRKTYYQVIRGGCMSFNVMGRSVSRTGATDKRKLVVFARRMMRLDPAHKGEYLAIAERMEGRDPVYGVTPLHTHYFRGDYTLHVRPKYFFDVRTFSKFTCKCESGNQENLKGYHLSNGSTCLMTDGDEYFDIFPYWDWSLVPGTTAPQADQVPAPDKEWGVPGSSGFAGGVSDGLYGVSAYSYADDRAEIATGAAKSWFCFDDEIVCLGQVRSRADAGIRTAVEQCRSSEKEEVTIMEGGAPTVLSQTSALLDNPRWVHHRRTGYVFPAGGKIRVSRQKQSGSWYDINHGESKKAVQGEVFSLSVEQGLRPEGVPYAYILVPAVSKEELAAWLAEDRIQIVRHTGEIQSVYHKKLKIWQTAFFAPGAVQLGELALSVDSGCLVMVRETGKDKYRLYVADPTRSRASIGIDFVSGGRKAHFQAALPAGVYAGRTVEYGL